jgi:predicted MFS family arabinose efflux permease
LSSRGLVPSPAPDAAATPQQQPSPAPWLLAALALGLAAAVSLGLARFAYALLLPGMRADLNWSYATAGLMNTVNAAGYLAGALLAPRALGRLDARHVMWAGGLGAAALLVAHGLVRGDAALYLLRFALGVASAASFVGGGLLAARLAAQPGAVSGLVLGLYYGGTGAGIVLSAWAVPWAMPQAAAWPQAWFALGALALLALLCTVAGSRRLLAPPLSASQGAGFRWAAFRFGLAGYACFGLGYIGYMTFIISLLREQGLSSLWQSLFFSLLGLGVLASSWLWAGLLQRHRDGKALALLNGLLALATLLPVLSQHFAALLVSGALFGAVFLSVVASTTAMVRHNAPPAHWPAGISAFTIVFAAGQIVGPSLVGAVADAGWGLRGGLGVCAAVLALGCALALRQRALASLAHTTVGAAAPTRTEDHSRANAAADCAAPPR